MKELTIEEKAKRYDEAIENGKQILNTPYTAHWDTMKEVVEHLLPELKESEDEMIRKELLEHCKNQAKPYIQTGNECPQIQSWIDWLEKQGEKDNLSIDFVLGYLGIKPAYKDGNAWCILLGDNIQEGICGFGDTKEEALIAFIKELIEKQSKKKSTIVDIMKNYFATTPKEQQDKDWEELKYLNDIGPDIEIAFGVNDSELKEKQGEKKPVDKIEPKFKVGDKIQYKKYTYTIKEVQEDCYVLDNDKVLTFNAQDVWELVEYNPANNIELSTFKNKLLELFQKFRGIIQGGVPTNGDIIDYVNAHIQELIDTIQNKSWSEDDEEMFKYAIGHFEIQKRNSIEGGLRKTSMQEFIDWIKSLKDRLV